jgi:hypothetical protein
MDINYIKSIPQKGLNKPELRRLSGHNLAEKRAVQAELKVPNMTYHRMKYLQSQLRYLTQEYRSILLGYKALNSND